MDLDRSIAELETAVYRSLIGLDERALAVAARAEAAGLREPQLRARLLFSDVLSRRGETAEGLRLQLELCEQARAEGLELLARRAALYLASTTDRLGMRAENLRWAAAAQIPAGVPAPAGWRAEALMVLALFTISHEGFAHDLAEHTVAEVRAVGNPVLTTVTLVNLAEVAVECGDLALGRRLSSEAVLLLGRHRSAAAALTWESIARVELACGDLDAADRALRRSFRLGARLGYCDVNGDPYLTQAELRLAQGRGQEALVILDRPERAVAARRSSWVGTRELAVRARILASLGRWQDAYLTMVRYVDAYEKVRSVEAERAAAESEATQTAEEERRRARMFEQLALRDPLTGLPNRRYVDERLPALAAGEPGAGAAPAAGLLSVAILDVDHFKQINDTYSHDIGDRVLIRVAALLENRPLPGKPGRPERADRAARGLPGGPPEWGFVARLGGEEFVLVLPGLSHAAAVAHCEQVLARLRAASFEDLARGLGVRASIGLVTQPVPTEAAALLGTADTCLYQAKRGGRDRLVQTTVLAPASGPHLRRRRDTRERDPR